MQESIPQYFDNKTRLVVDDLKNQLSSNPKVAIAAASFSIYAFEALKDELEDVEELRFIFTSPTFIREKKKKEKRGFAGRRTSSLTFPTNWYQACSI